MKKNKVLADTNFLVPAMCVCVYVQNLTARVVNDGSLMSFKKGAKYSGDRLELNFKKHFS